MAPTNARFRFHSDRDRLLAEAHARPSTPLKAPALASRIAAFSGEGGVDADRAHVAAQCRRLGAPEPGPNARWCVVHAGLWRLRWERHTEVSTWTFIRELRAEAPESADATAMDAAPQDWLSALPGDILVAAHFSLLREAPAALPFSPDEIVASDIGGAFDIYTDFRPGPDLFTRFYLVQKQEGAALAGRVLQQLMEIETYRLLAMLAFPVALNATATIARFEAETSALAEAIVGAGNVTEDRALLARVAALASQAEAHSGQTAFRFAAAQAYHGLVNERLAQLRETAFEGRPSIADFMERRLAPAMRTCSAVGHRQQQLIARIARAAQLLDTRVQVAAEATNAELLASMDRRSKLQLRLQQTVEGLSVAAIAYYALGLLKYAIDGIAKATGRIDPTIATGIAAPIVVLGVWAALRQIRQSLHAPKKNKAV